MFQPAFGAMEPDISDRADLYTSISGLKVMAKLLPHKNVVSPRRSDHRVWTGGGLWLPCSVQEPGYWGEGLYPTDRALLLYYNPQQRCHLIIDLHSLVAVLFLFAAPLPQQSLISRPPTILYTIFWQKGNRRARPSLSPRSRFGSR